jgi:hypothetical protein
MNEAGGRSLPQPLCLSSCCRSNRSCRSRRWRRRSRHHNNRSRRGRRAPVYGSAWREGMSRNRSWGG